jgi:8-amino-7-oxononanoate synthase
VPGQLDVVLTESIFSMDGDAADLAGIAQLKSEFDFALLIDEAHGSGVYGPDGNGYAAELGFAGLADVSICTLSKALGLVGGAVCATRSFCEGVVNFGRAYIYSTAVPAGLGVLAQEAIRIVHDEPQRQRRVRQLAKTTREKLIAGDLSIPPGDSPIIPVILGEEGRTLAAAATLLEGGIFCVAVRPPTVARGASRLRVTLSCEHSDAEVELLIDRIKALPRS